MLTKTEVIAQYGTVKLAFASYYKYSFSFVGTADDGAIISASIGGNSDDIYRLTVSPDDVKTLYEDEELFSSVLISKDGTPLYQRYSY